MGNASEAAKGWKSHEFIRAGTPGGFHAVMSQLKNIYRPVYVCVGAGGAAERLKTARPAIIFSKISNFAKSNYRQPTNRINGLQSLFVQSLMKTSVSVSRCQVSDLRHRLLARQNAGGTGEEECRPGPGDRKPAAVRAAIRFPAGACEALLQIAEARKGLYFPGGRGCGGHAPRRAAAVAQRAEGSMETFMNLPRRATPWNRSDGSCAPRWTQAAGPPRRGRGAGALWSPCGAATGSGRRCCRSRRSARARSRWRGGRIGLSGRSGRTTRCCFSPAACRRRRTGWRRRRAGIARHRMR